MPARLAALLLKERMPALRHANAPAQLDALQHRQACEHSWMHCDLRTHACTTGGIMVHDGAVHDGAASWYTTAGYTTPYEITSAQLEAR